MRKQPKATVYWLHLAEHTDILTQGYIGVAKDAERRFRHHKTRAANNTNNNPHLQSAFAKYGDDIIMSVIVYNTKDYCYEKEQHLRPHKYIGWNIESGGGQLSGMTGRNHSEETKRKLSKKVPWNKGLKGVLKPTKTSFKKGHKQSDDVKKKIGNAHRGKTGHKDSEDTKLKKRIAQQKRRLREHGE